MSNKKIKLYTKTGAGTVIDIKDCKVLIESLPNWKEVVERIQEKEVPILVYIDAELFKTIDTEIKRKGNTFQRPIVYEIFYQSTNYIPIIIVGTKEGIDLYFKIKETQIENKK